MELLVKQLAIRLGWEETPAIFSATQVDLNSKPRSTAGLEFGYKSSYGNPIVESNGGILHNTNSTFGVSFCLE